jgi:hypothetical protein
MMGTIYISSSLMPRQGTLGFFSLLQMNHQLSLSTHSSTPMVSKLDTVLFILTRVVNFGSLTLYATLQPLLVMSWNLLAVIAHIKMEKLNVSMALLVQWFDLSYTPQDYLLNIGVLPLSMLFTLKTGSGTQLLMLHHLRRGMALNLMSPICVFLVLY